MSVIYRLGYGLVMLLIVIMGLLGVLILARIVLLFFGSLKALPGYDTIVNLTDPYVTPLKGVEGVKTPYRGVFDLPAVIILLLIIILESFFSIFRGILGRRVSRASRRRSFKKK